MHQLLKFLANPLYVGIVSLLMSLLLISKQNYQEEYLSFTFTTIVSLLFFMFLFFALPFVIISMFTRKRVRQPNKQNRLIGLWLGSVGAALVWILSIVFSTNGQAGLGYMWVGGIAIAGGIVGYLVGWGLSD